MLSVVAVVNVVIIKSIPEMDLIDRLNNNFLYLDFSKTKVMLTGTHQGLAVVDSFTVRAGDTVQSRAYQFKYLSVMLDPYLSWFVIS